MLGVVVSIFSLSIPLIAHPQPTPVFKYFPVGTLSQHFAFHSAFQDYAFYSAPRVFSATHFLDAFDIP